MTPEEITKLAVTRRLYDTTIDEIINRVKESI